MGNRIDYLRQAREILNIEAGQIVLLSSIYESEPWGYNDPDKYLNQVVSIKTAKEPQQLLESCLHIENTLGRKRLGNTYQPRPIDIDILFYNDLCLETKSLIIPHPRLHLRNFVLKPLMEILPDLKHPKLKMSVKELFKLCPDTIQVKKNPST